MRLRIELLNKWLRADAYHIIVNRKIVAVVVVVFVFY